MSNSEIQELQEGLRSARDAVLAAIDGISERETHEVPAPGEWTVAQVLAHIAEIHTFWVGKAVLIIREDDPQITRTAVENDLRMAAVTDHAQDNLDDLKREMTTVCEEALATVGEFDPKDLGRPGHREENPMTAGGVIQFLAGHVRTHAGQIIEARRLIREKR